VRRAGGGSNHSSARIWRQHGLPAIVLAHCARIVDPQARHLRHGVHPWATSGNQATRLGLRARARSCSQHGGNKCSTRAAAPAHWQPTWWPYEYRVAFVRRNATNRHDFRQLSHFSHFKLAISDKSL
jgi:hypothetical protein